MNTCIATDLTMLTSKHYELTEHGRLLLAKGLNEEETPEYAGIEIFTALFRFLHISELLNLIGSYF